MTEPFEDILRSQQAKFDSTGKPVFRWTTTLTSLTDTVKLVVPPNHVVPVIFIPGIMGSNLMGSDKQPVWLMNRGSGINQPLGLAWMWARKNPGQRQSILHPKRTSVYSFGNVPDPGARSGRSKSDYIARGWGEVGETSYHEFLLWLENKLNREGWNPAEWKDFSYTAISATPQPGAAKVVPKLHGGILMQMQGLPPFAEEGHATQSVLSDELLKRAKCLFPVYACGYNWLESNMVAAERLSKRIDHIISENRKGPQECNQVILVTHSMGGLVARACLTLSGISAKVAGIVHGVMPSTGAPVAYRRCKVGMSDEGGLADKVPAAVIGSSGREVTAVFAQAPGALQLLPSEGFGKNWLQIKDEHGKVLESLPNADPYSEIYLRKDKWWGLVDQRWLTPKNGVAIEWNEFATNIDLAQEFHSEIKSSFHRNTFVYYGAGDKKEASFETIQWQLSRGITPSEGTRPAAGRVPNHNFIDVRTDGDNAIYIGGKTEIIPAPAYMSSGGTYETSFWKIICAAQDGKGDGTVPASSGASPRKTSGKNVQQQFRISGFLHEASYKSPMAQRVTHYAITKIVGMMNIR